MWIKLSQSLLHTALTKQELDAFNIVAKPFEIERELQDVAHVVAETWRGRLRQYRSVDKREDFVPESLLYFILCHYRYAAGTRLPNIGILIDELRVREYEKAMEILNDPRKIKIDDPEEEEEDTGNVLPKVIPNGRAWRFE